MDWLCISRIQIAEGSFARKNLEFCSSTSGMGDGPTLCWHPMVGKYLQKAYVRTRRFHFANRKNLQSAPV